MTLVKMKKEYQQKTTKVWQTSKHNPFSQYCYILYEIIYIDSGKRTTYQVLCRQFSQKKTLFNEYRFQGKLFSQIEVLLYNILNDVFCEELETSDEKLVTFHQQFGTRNVIDPNDSAQEFIIFYIKHLKYFHPNKEVRDQKQPPHWQKLSNQHLLQGFLVRSVLYPVGTK